MLVPVDFRVRSITRVWNFSSDDRVKTDGLLFGLEQVGGYRGDSPATRFGVHGR